MSDDTKHPSDTEHVCTMTFDSNGYSMWWTCSHCGGQDWMPGYVYCPTCGYKSLGGYDPWQEDGHRREPECEEGCSAQGREAPQGGDSQRQQA